MFTDTASVVQRLSQHYNLYLLTPVPLCYKVCGPAVVTCTVFPLMREYDDSLKKDRACNRVLREVPSEVKRKLNLDLEEACVTLGKSFASLKI